jgi:hypothetical protein
LPEKVVFVLKKIVIVPAISATVILGAPAASFATVDVRAGGETHSDMTVEGAPNDEVETGVTSTARGADAGALIWFGLGALALGATAVSVVTVKRRHAA